jgi:hypothetical protein
VFKWFNTSLTDREISDFVAGNVTPQNKIRKARSYVETFARVALRPGEPRDGQRAAKGSIAVEHKRDANRFSR